MNNGDSLLVIKMRMRIVVVLLAVSSPPRVANCKELIVSVLGFIDQSLNAVSTIPVQRGILVALELLRL